MKPIKNLLVLSALVFGALGWSILCVIIYGAFLFGNGKTLIDFSRDNEIHFEIFAFTVILIFMFIITIMFLKEINK